MRKSTEEEHSYFIFTHPEPELHVVPPDQFMPPPVLKLAYVPKKKVALSAHCCQSPTAAADAVPASKVREVVVV